MDEQIKTPSPAPKLSPVAGTSDHALMKWFVGVGSLIFFATLILWTASLTLEVMGIVMPNNPTAKWYSLALFDGAALVWLGLYRYKAKGTPQRGVSLMLFVFDFACTVLMAAGGIYLGGQTLANVPTWLGQWIINVLIGATLANVGAGYYYKISDPEAREEAQAQSLEDEINEEAFKQARANIRREARQLGSIMSQRATSRIKYRLALPMTEEERAAWEGEIVEGQVVPPLQLAAPADEVPAWVRGVFRFFGRGGSRPHYQSEPITTTPTSEPSSNEPKSDVEANGQ
jgi:hypothetical protein